MPMGDTIVCCIAQVDLPQGIQSFLERVTERPWVALAELILIGSIVYAVLRFLRGTRGARLVRAVLIILGVSFAVVWLLAERFDLERINVLYPYFILGVFLISLVAFQIELRRILLRLGQGGWLQRWLRSTDVAVDPIVAAVGRLAKKKIGALIAIERTAELGAVVESGIRLDAVVSAELLETIFWPGTVLHDLGVIISQGRVVAAGCQFPLVESGDVDRSLGSRHRAALGMSHEVDAVVIVVSEETGTISVATQGRLRRALTVDALRDVLHKEFATQTPPAAPRGEIAKPLHPTQEASPDGTGQAA